MPNPWPFAGRTEDLRTVRSAAGGVIVAGPPGVGKSRLVGHAVRDLDGVAWVRATRSAAEIPLGAFAHLLPPMPAGVNTLGWAADALKAPVLVVDDAHLLDPVSAALVHHVVTRRRTRVLATVRTTDAVPDAVVALWKDGLLHRLDLGPLSPAEAARLVEAALGGRVESTARRRLWQVSQGNALYLRELVLSGVLSDVGGLWLWQGSLTLTATLRETVEARLGVLAADERAALEFLAYGEPLGAGTLAALASPSAAESLEDRQLVTVRPDGNRLLVRLAHPLYGEVIRDRCGTLRARKVLRALAEAVEAAGARRREDVLRVAVWRLDGGVPGEPGPLAAACESARAVRDLELAERLGRAAVAAGGGPHARVGLARVLSCADRPLDAEEVFAEAWASDMGEHDRVECGVNRAVNLSMGLGRVAEARALLAETAAAVTSDESRRAVRVLDVVLDVSAGDLVAARSTVSELRAGPVTGRLAYGLVPAEAALLAAEGRPVECLAQVRTALDMLEGAPENLPSMTAAVTEAAVVATVLLGDLAGAEEHVATAQRLYGEFGTWNRAIALFNSRRAQIHRLRGRPAEAVAWCLDAAARLPEPSPDAGICFGELAHAYALLGDPAAEETLARGVAAVLPFAPYVSFPLEQAKVWILAGQGDIPGAIRTALGAVTHPCDEPFALHDVVRLGRPDLVADRLARLPIDGPLVALFARHAAATTPAGLEGVSAAFEDMGLILHAAEAAAQAGDLYERIGRARQAQGARSRAWTLARRCEGARTPALLTLAAPDLTPRQREIARLAASGLTNREIAARLVVSVRTVGNTLVAVYEKVGVSDRAALTGLLNLLG
ncbi:helix-turn-helix transcriptional regulator [Sphaerisporangium corydalis]|uniref:LuxR C-terminal-related transcriptional regulator n=1 Tax=Sphaerisporangium corydalis TaxID=1441875 RepID=A0ABV9EMU0_9ACTN|nr:LuxR family transcriptional regulator [Sphaerisporangium corydalis]